MFIMSVVSARVPYASTIWVSSVHRVCVECWCWMVWLIGWIVSKEYERMQLQCYNIHLEAERNATRFRFQRGVFPISIPIAVYNIHNRFEFHFHCGFRCVRFSFIQWCCGRTKELQILWKKISLRIVNWIEKYFCGFFPIVQCEFLVIQYLFANVNVWVLWM